jgi:hypothetical protein
MCLLDPAAGRDRRRCRHRHAVVGVAATGRAWPARFVLFIISAVLGIGWLTAVIT